jgi:glycosyltransferase involved in cell wall biosynthesis
MSDSSESKRPTLSALVVAHNEEEVLEDCLKRLNFADEIMVLLDRCTDRSKEIAEEYAHKIVEGAWEFEGERRNKGIESCTSDWIIDADADEWISDDLANEILETIATTEFDIFDIPVRNYIGGTFVEHGWGGGSFGKVSYLGLYRKHAKSYGIGRFHAHVMEHGKRGPDLKNHLDHYVDGNVSDILRRLDRYTDYRAADLVDQGEIGSLPNYIRKFLSRFIKVYFRRKAYKEGGYGFMIALCGALYPLVSHIKAANEVGPAKAAGQQSREETAE